MTHSNEKVCGKGHTFSKEGLCPTCLANWLDKGGCLDQCDPYHTTPTACHLAISQGIC